MSSTKKARKKCPLNQVDLSRHLLKRDIKKSTIFQWCFFCFFSGVMGLVAQEVPHKFCFKDIIEDNENH